MTSILMPLARSLPRQVAECLLLCFAAFILALFRPPSASIWRRHVPSKLHLCWPSVDTAGGACLFQSVASVVEITHVEYSPLLLSHMGMQAISISRSFRARTKK